MSAALDIDPTTDDEEALDDEALPIGNSWAPHLLDDEPATAIAALKSSLPDVVVDSVSASRRRVTKPSKPKPKAIATSVEPSRPKVTKPRAPKISAVELIDRGVKAGAKRFPRVPGAPFVDEPELQPSKGGVTFRWRAFVVEFRDLAAAAELLRVARKESR